MIANNILARGTEGGVQFGARALKANCLEAEQLRPGEELVDCALQVQM